MNTKVFLVVAVLIFGAAQVHAQQPTFAQLAAGGCSGALQYGGAQWCFDGDNATDHAVWYWNGMAWIFDTPIINTLANLGTCNTATTGHIAVQTNSTSACAAGATATSAGTTHCVVFCNGTNWIQTGY
jgi:hypothetical protein